MSLFSILGEIAEAMTTGQNNGKPAVQRSRPMPVENVKALMQQGREREAVILLRNSMGWNEQRAEQFINSLKSAERTAKQDPRQTRSKNSTQIENILREQKLAEDNAGGSLLDYLKAKFTKFK